MVLNESRMAGSQGQAQQLANQSARKMTEELPRRVVELAS